MNAAPEAELVRRALDGDAEAYGELVRRHQEPLYRYARAMGLDRDTAMDMVQDGFVRGYRGLDRCRDPENFERWIFRIIRNRCLDHLRDIRRRTVSVDDLTLIDPAPDPARRAVAEEIRTRVHAALRSLSGDLREAFVLKHVEERSYEEMANLTGASVSALKMRVHRARDALRNALQHHTSDVSM